MEHQSHRRVKRILISALLLLLVAYIVVPPRKVDILAYLPDDSLAIGFHKELRASWKRQLRHPVVASFLAGYGLEPRDVIKSPGAFWTFLLAIGEDAASAAMIQEASPHSRLVLAAASPAGRRNLLLTAFWHMRWVPGLGRIEDDEQGRHFIRLDDDDGDESTERPLFLSVAFGNGVLRVKLSEAPEHMADMDGRSTRRDDFARLLASGERRGPSHRLRLIPDNIEAHCIPYSFGEYALDIGFDGDALAISAMLPGMVSNSSDGCAPGLFDYVLTGVNSTAQALAGGHAFAFMLAPSGPVAKLATDFFGCSASPAQGEDAAIYLTAPPYGGNFLFFSIPAITASIPGLELDMSRLRAAISPLPKQLRAPFALHGESTVCSSAASLRAQRMAPPPAGRTWETGFAKFRNFNPSLFLHVDCDQLFGQLLQVAGAIPVAASFARDSIDPFAIECARLAQTAIPRFPTGLSFDSAAFATNGALRVNCLLSR